MMRRGVLACALILKFCAVFPQADSITSVRFDGYIETYYGYDFNRPADNTRPSFIYAYNRHNEVNVNLGFVRASYDSKTVRAHLALMTGTYANANMAAEPGVLKNIYEANAGIKLSSTRNLWVDAGVFASHIGFESAVGKDCWTLTRSIAADNTPYYEDGAKLTYQNESGKWMLSALVLNGWQHIQRIAGNSRPSFGTQVTYKPTAALTINSSTFIGTDKPDSLHMNRYFHDLYAIIDVNPRLSFILGFDYGLQRKPNWDQAYDTWYAATALARFKLNSKISLAARGEYYHDGHGVVIAAASLHGFQTLGTSLNMDYRVHQNVLWRIEARSLKSRDTVFKRSDSSVKDDVFISTAIAVSL